MFHELQIAAPEAGYSDRRRYLGRSRRWHLPDFYFSIAGPVAAWLAVHEGASYASVAGTIGLEDLEAIAAEEDFELRRHNHERRLSAVLGPVLAGLSEVERCTMELAAFVAALAESGISPAGGWDGTGCPFQIGKLCGGHGFRPFGCRVFFCDPTATQWQQEQYEQFHGKLRKLHDELGVPYFYVEWRAGLEAMGFV